MEFNSNRGCSGLLKRQSACNELRLPTGSVVAIILLCEMYEVDSNCTQAKVSVLIDFAIKSMGLSFFWDDIS